jgi:hypothetical protein
VTAFGCGLLNKIAASSHRLLGESSSPGVSPPPIGERYASCGEPFLAAFTDPDRVRFF